MLEYFVERDIFAMDVCKTRYYEKNVKVFFFTWKVSFFRKFLFSTFTQLVQNWSCNLHNNCSNHFWANGIASWCHDAQQYERRQAKIIGKIPFFKKNSPSASKVLTNWSFILQKKSQKTIWVVINCSLRFLILHRTRKEGQISSFTNNCVFNSITGNTRKKGQNRVSSRKTVFSKKIPMTSHVL